MTSSQAERVEELLIRAQYKTMDNSIPQDKLIRLCLAQLRWMNRIIRSAREKSLWEDVQNAMRAM